MNVSRSEAADALSQIGQAAGKATRFAGYRHSAVYFVIWGLVWLVANTVTHVQPEQAGLAWGAGIAFGMIASFAVGFMQNRTVQARADGSEPPAPSWRIGLTSVIVFGFFVCVFSILRPEGSAEINAMISIFFAFLYMIGGVWAGWRLFGIGLVLALAIMGGYYFLRDVYSLWMGVVGGGALIAGGLWLRSA